MNFKVGQTVQVQSMPPDDKDSEPGWPNVMDRYLGGTGVVQRIKENGHIVVKFEDATGYRTGSWEFLPSWLTLSEASSLQNCLITGVLGEIQAGDEVIVCSETPVDDNGPGWNKTPMDRYLGCRGVVLSIDEDSHIQVQFEDGKDWFFLAEWLTLSKLKPEWAPINRPDNWGAW